MTICIPKPEFLLLIVHTLDYRFMKKVLFLGVSNYCASRFAEIIFNHLVSEHLLNFKSISRGIRVQPQNQTVDPRTIDALTVRGVLLSNNLRPAKSLNPTDLKQADYIVLISGSELAPRLERAKGIESSQIITWEFNQVETTPSHALYPALEAEVFLLIRWLQHQQYPYLDRITA